MAITWEQLLAMVEDNKATLRESGDVGFSATSAEMAREAEQAACKAAGEVHKTIDMDLGGGMQSLSLAIRFHFPDGGEEP